MKKILCPIGILLFLSTMLSCKKQRNNLDYVKLMQERDSLLGQLQSDETAVNDKLVHLVFFKTKDATSADSLGLALSKLKSIESLNELYVGKFKDLGDPRAMAAYDLVLYTSFEDSLAYKKYQSHPLHIGLKEATKSFLAAQPVTYDYENE